MDSTLKTFDKRIAVELLGRMRSIYKLLPEAERSGFRSAAILVMQSIESNTPEPELWSRLPDEKQLTDDARVGEHLSVTRMVMGLLA